MTISDRLVTGVQRGAGKDCCDLGAEMDLAARPHVRFLPSMASLHSLQSHPQNGECVKGLT